MVGRKVAPKAAGMETKMAACLVEQTVERRDK